MLGGGGSKVVSTDRVVSDRRGVQMGQEGLPQSQEGVAIPVLFGSGRINPILIWIGPRRIVVTEHTEKQHVGGKGGGGDTVKMTTYSEEHFQTWAVMLGKGPVRAVKRIWFNAILVYSAEHWRDDDTKNESEKLADKIAFYPGTMTQNPDPTMQAYMGPSTTPAFRGRAYIVFNEVSISAFGNAIPQVSVEFCADGHGGILEASDGPVPLAQIVGRICGMCGLAESDVDCSQLGDMVDGFVIDSISAGRNILEPLKTAFLFDVRDTGRKIEFLKRPQPVWRDEYEDRVFLNERGLLINAYHGELGRAGLFSGSAGTSEGMTLLLQACAHAYRMTGKQSWLDRAMLVWDGLETVCYRAPIPNAVGALWLPHWLVNVRAPIQAQTYRMHVQLRFLPIVGGVQADLPTGPGYYGDLASQVFVVYSPTSWPISEMPNAEIVGDDIPAKTYQFEFIPPSNGDPGKVFLPGESKPLDAVVGYAYNAGAYIDVNEPFEVDPVTRVLRDAEISCAPDAAEWAVAAFDEMYLATSDTRWSDARAAAVESCKQIFDIDDGRGWFRPQPTTSAFSLIGTASYSKRMGMTPANWRRDPLSGNIIGYIPAVVDLTRMFEAQIIRGLSHETRKAQDTHIRVEISCNVTSAGRIFVFLRRSINFKAEDTWYAPLVLIAGAGIQKFDIPFNQFRRMVAQGANGVLSKGEPVVNTVWTPNTNKTEGEVLTSTNFNGYKYQCLTDGQTGATEPTWPTTIGASVSDGTTSWYCIGYAGFPIGETVRNVGISDWETKEHTLTIRRIRPMPLIPMPYTPYVTAFTVITMAGQISDWRGPPGTGYQFPDIWARTGETARLNGMLAFLKDAADKYALDYGARGPMMPVYVWQRADNEDYGPVDEWSWQWTDPNTMWAGYQYRPMQSIANAARRTGDATAKALCGDFYTWLDGLWPGWPNYIITEIPQQIAAWDTGTKYHEGRFNSDTSLIRPTTPNGYLYRCVQTGTSGAVEPSWPTTLGGQVADGGTKWECSGYAYSVTTPAFGNYHEPHFAALVWRGALYARMANISPSVNTACVSLMGKCYTYLDNLYNTSGTMNGTFCAYPVTMDWYGFWHAEIIETLCAVKEHGATWHSPAEMAQIDVWLDGLDEWTTANTRTLTSLDPNDFGASAPRNKPHAWYEMKSRQDKELPYEVSVTYPSPGQDYARGVQRARMPMQTGTQQRANIDMPVVMTPALAQSVSYRQLYLTWGERDRYTINVSRRLSHFEPGDTIPVPMYGTEAPMRIERVDRGVSGLLKMEMVPHLPDVVRYTTTFAGARIGGSAHSIPGVAPTIHDFIDSPLARDTDAEHEGFYCALTGYWGWRGAVAQRTNDGGSTWETIVTRANPTVYGQVYGTLAGGVSPAVLDLRTVIAVSVVNGSLESVTEAEMLNGANTAMIGDEMLRFMNAALQPDGSYLISGFQRGIRGTEWAINSHGPDERFVMMNAALPRAPLPLSRVGIQMTYRVVSAGEIPDDVVPFNFTGNAVGLKPYAPCHAAATRNGSGDITLTWIRRTRIGGEWRASVDAALSETAERYDVELLSDDETTVLATVTTTVPTTTVSASTQTALYGGLKPAMKVRVYQVSEAVGRGFPLAATV